MTDGAFIDTNVLVYLLGSDERKASIAESLLREQSPVVSVQVLDELTHVCRRKLAMPWPDVRGFLDVIRQLVQVSPVTLGVHHRGLAVAERFGLGVHDAMVVAAAIEVGARRLYTEDMQDGLVIDGTMVLVNPFRSSALR